jgi:hypothetical protein
MLGGGLSTHQGHSDFWKHDSLHIVSRRQIYSLAFEISRARDTQPSFRHQGLYPGIRRPFLERYQIASRLRHIAAAFKSSQYEFIYTRSD